MRIIHVKAKSDDAKNERMEIDSAFIQHYRSAGDVVFRIKRQCSFYLLEWIISEMSEYNHVILNKGSRLNFLNYVAKFGARYTDEAARKSIRDLVDAGVIMSLSQDGGRESMYMVNPVYFWRTASQSDRIESIKIFHDLKSIKHEENKFRQDSKNGDASGSSEAQ